MSNMDKAHKRIEQLYQGELSQHEPTVRAALGRRLEVDARFRAIENYLEELTFDVEHTRGRCACGLPFAEHPAGLSEACGPALSPGPAGSVIGNLAEATPEDVPSVPPVGRHDGSGEDLSAERARLRREYYAERIDEYDAAEFVGAARREGFPTDERVQRWRREDAACRAKERAAGSCHCNRSYDPAMPHERGCPENPEAARELLAETARALGDDLAEARAEIRVKADRIAELLKLIGQTESELRQVRCAALAVTSSWRFSKSNRSIDGHMFEKLEVLESILRGIGPAHPAVKSSPSEDNTARAKSLQEQVYALQDRLSECDEDDSRRLRLMCDVIDDKIGWDNEEQQEAGDYLARLQQIADELPELREAKRRAMHADSDVKQARAVRDKALEVIEAARPLEAIELKDTVPLGAALERLAKAVKAYDWEEIPF